MRSHGEIPEFRRRYRYLVVAVVLAFVVLVGRLWQLQVLRGGYYREQTRENFVQERRLGTVRGLIYDKRGRLLVGVRPSFDLYVTPHFFREDTADRLLDALAVGPERARVLRRRMESVAAKRGRRILLLHDISRDQVARVEARRSTLRGVDIHSFAQRDYPYGKLAAHALGYMSEISADELASDHDHSYQPGDTVGRFGVERMYEAHLRGVPGSERLIVDARGRRIEAVSSQHLLHGPRRVEPKPGHNLVLTIDLDIQRVAERALRRYPSGAAVVLEADTGRILASASRPAFDPNKLSGRLTPAEARELLENPYRPLLDKVYRENYFPGSTFKVVTAMAGIEGGFTNWSETVTCKGWHTFGRRAFRCSHVHGKVNLHQAIVESCNVYFYEMAERIGMDTIADYARRCGLGATTGLGLNGEVGGFIPTKSWYQRQGRAFRVGYTLNTAIGQGSVKVTPLQIAALYAAIGNGGRLYAPQIVERIETASGEVLQSFSPRLRRRLDVAPQTLARLRSALEGVVEDKKGTAHDMYTPGLRIAGKTGTAQVTRRGHKTSKMLDDHAWFAAYAPADAPEIAVVVLIEHGGQAAKVAAPVAAQIIRGTMAVVAARSVANGEVVSTRAIPPPLPSSREEAP